MQCFSIFHGERYSEAGEPSIFAEILPVPSVGVEFRHQKASHPMAEINHLGWLISASEANPHQLTSDN
jgi:hypothetical protein